MRSVENKVLRVEICKDTSYIDLHTLDALSGDIVSTETVKIPTFILACDFTSDGKYIYTQEPDFNGIHVYRYLVNPNSNVSISETKEYVNSSTSAAIDLVRAQDDDLYIQCQTHLSAILDASSDTPIHIDSFLIFDKKMYGLFGNPVVSLLGKYDREKSPTFSDTVICEGELINIPIPQGYMVVSEGDTLDVNLEISKAKDYIITIIDTNYCTILDTILVAENANCQCSIYVPNAINLSSASENSEWQISSECSLAMINIKIYDRWGALVFSSKSEQASWNGKANNGQVATGVYTYMLEYIYLGDRNTHFKTGTITVIK